MKKYLIMPLLLYIALSVIVGCTPKTEYDDLEIIKIETSWHEGFAPFSGEYVRTFDFKNGSVYDTLATDADISEILEHTPGLTAEDLNTPKLVSTFTEEQASKLYDKIKSLGFLAWKDKYISDDQICDGGSESVTVYFADGTEKHTRIYFKDPPKYDKIREAFEEYLGVSFYSGR
ncbi:MAG: hypothetical protein HDT28_04445 [Clostridiales bacterium]|nr:hypothetical protein [Clostridiales bacterium]